MKTSRLQTWRSAFTLIELLVVISIIAVLAGMSFPAITSVMVTARKTQAKNDMAQIASAVKLYYTEYGRYPIDTTTVTDDKSATYGASTAQGNEQIISVLRDKKSTNVAQTTLDALNPRQIQFIEPKVTALSKGCVNTTSGSWFDPWGTQYLIFIDADYANDIDVTTAFTGMDTPQVSVGVASVGYYYVKNKTKTQPAILSAARAYSSTTDLLSWR